MVERCYPRTLERVSNAAQEVVDNWYNSTKKRSNRIGILRQMYNESQSYASELKRGKNYGVFA